MFAGVEVLALALLISCHRPAIFLIFLAVILIAFRYGPQRRRARFPGFPILNALTVTFSGLGRAVRVNPPQPPEAGSFLPQFVATVFFTSLLTSMVVSRHERLRRLVENRNRIANLARRRAVLASKAKSDFLVTMSDCWKSVLR